jgi:hypothetical protein
MQSPNSVEIYDSLALNAFDSLRLIVTRARNSACFLQENAKSNSTKGYARDINNTYQVSTQFNEQKCYVYNDHGSSKCRIEKSRR